MAGLVLSDASPLIGLARIGGLLWLGPLFGEVWLPAEVHHELFAKDGAPDQESIAHAISEGVLKVWTHPVPNTPELPGLDEGETACIRIGVAQQRKTLLLIDELAGRHAARTHGLSIAGTAAVIGLAKSKGLIPSAREAFARLHASDFRIAPQVIRQVLEGVGEGN